MPVSPGSRTPIQEAGAGAWTALRTLLNQPAEGGTPPIATVTGSTDLTGYAYPGAFAGSTLTIDDAAYTFAIADPIDEASLLADLTAQFADYTFDIDVAGGRFLRITKNDPGNFAASGNLLAAAGIAEGTQGVWADFGTEYPVVEVSYESLAAAGAPDNVLLHVWRLVGTKDDIVGTINIPIADIATWRAERVQLDARYVYITVGFTGGAAPNLSGSVEVRFVRSGETTLGQAAGGGGTATNLAVDADDDPVTANTPVLIGGVHRADPAADPVDDLDVGTILINEQRMPVVESRAHDPVSGADKVLSVHQITDDWAPEDLSSSLGADGSVVKYVAGLPHIRPSIQFVPTPAAAEKIALRFAVSNENTGDVTTQTYTDVTEKVFGVPYIDEEDVVEAKQPITALTWRITVTVTGWTAGVSAWDAFLLKGGNS